MARVPLKLLAADAVLLVAAYLVVRDQDARAAYAASLHTACPGLCGYTPSFSYGVLIQYFTMAGHGVTLTSPPTLDWLQVVALLLVLLNGWYAYSNFLRPKKPPKDAQEPAAPVPP